MPLTVMKPLPRDSSQMAWSWWPRSKSNVAKDSVAVPHEPLEHDEPDEDDGGETDEGRFVPELRLHPLDQAWAALFVGDRGFVRVGATGSVTVCAIGRRGYCAGLDFFLIVERMYDNLKE